MDGEDFPAPEVDIRHAAVRVNAMEKTSSTAPRTVAVRATPIELSQFIKFGGLAESGGEAKQKIAEGGVLLNGAVETRKSKQLNPGDRVTVDGQTIVVAVSPR